MYSADVLGRLLGLRIGAYTKPFKNKNFYFSSIYTVVFNLYGPGVFLIAYLHVVTLPRSTILGMIRLVILDFGQKSLPISECEIIIKLYYFYV